MSVAKITETYLDNIADAIRFKRMSEDTYTPPEMADAIMAIQGGPNAVAVVNSVDPDTGGLIKTIVGTDISSDTVTSGSLLKGYTAHMADGTFIEGEYQGGAGDVTQDENGYIILGKDGSDEPSGAISVVDTIDPVSGGTIRSINAVNISNDTVTAATLLSGYTAHDAAGDAVTGTVTAGYSLEQVCSVGFPAASGAITFSGTRIRPWLFYKNATMTSFVGDSVTSIAGDSWGSSNISRAFSNCSNLEYISFMSLTDMYHSDYPFSDCTKLKTANFDYKNITKLPAGFFNNCPALEKQVYVMPKLVSAVYGNFLTNNSHITSMDIGSSSVSADSECRIRSNAFNGDANFNLLIIRNTNLVRNLENVNAFGSTCFESGKSGGTLYVPSSLLSSYSSATNWSTILGYANNQIKAIEGSYYETHYADGTVISS